MLKIMYIEFIMHCLIIMNVVFGCGGLFKVIYFDERGNY